MSVGEYNHVVSIASTKKGAKQKQLRQGIFCLLNTYLRRKLHTENFLV